MQNCEKRFSYNLLIDVVAASGGETIETYFADLVTKWLLKFCDNTGENCEELLPGVQFTYRGEVTSTGGDTYSDVGFVLPALDVCV